MLTGDAVALMSLGLFNFGIVLPGSIGIAFLLLALWWDRVARWRRGQSARTVAMACSMDRVCRMARDSRCVFPWHP
ncbi:hypothetical protein ACTMU2_07685 [Cupriavidus basilensis]